MKTPSFRYMGGKARLRNKLIPLFPKEGNRYIELFVGAGNIFFAAKQRLNYKYFILNDLYSYNFLTSLLTADTEELPDKVDKNLFAQIKEYNNDISRVLEPRISFAGKGYKHGFNGEGF